MRIVGLAVVMAALAVAGHAQVEGKLDLSVSGGSIFGKNISQPTSAVSLSPHYSAAVFGSVRYHVNHLHAVEIDLGHAGTSQIFVRPPDTFIVNADVFEFSGSYVLTPYHDRRLQPFLFAGVAGLHWSPNNQWIDQVQVNFGAVRQNSLAFSYGGGADYTLWRRLALRLQYRGLIYRAPDFGVPNLFISAKDHMAEPAAGLVFKF